MKGCGERAARASPACETTDAPDQTKGVEPMMPDRREQVKRPGPLVCEEPLAGGVCGRPAAVLDPTRGMMPLCSDHRELPDEEAVLLHVRRSEAEGSVSDG